MISGVMVYLATYVKIHVLQHASLYQVKKILSERTGHAVSGTEMRIFNVM